MYRSSKKHHKFLLVAGLIALTFILSSALAPAAQANSNGIDVTFTGAAPQTYNHRLGGGAYNDGTIDNSADISFDLQGSGLACGDTVTYLVLITVALQTTAVDQVVELNFAFAARPTGQPGVAHIAVTSSVMNYGLVENGDNGSGSNPGRGAYGLDSAITDDRQRIASGDRGVGGSQVRLASSSFSPANTTPFNGAENLLHTVQVDDLDPGERVVLRLDTTIGCQPGSTPRGNLRSRFTGGSVIAQNGQPVTPQSVSGGNRQVNLKSMENAAGVAEPLLHATYTVMLPGGSCGVDDVKSLTAYVGQTVTYCVKISNPGTEILYDVQAEDSDSRTASSVITLTGLADLDGQGDLGDLAASGTATGQYSVVYGAPTVDNRSLTVSGKNGKTQLNLNAIEAVQVIVASPTAIELSATRVVSGSNQQQALAGLAILGVIGILLTAQAIRLSNGLALPLRADSER